MLTIAYYCSLFLAAAAVAAVTAVAAVAAVAAFRVLSIGSWVCLDFAFRFSIYPCLTQLSTTNYLGTQQANPPTISDKRRGLFDQLTSSASCAITMLDLAVYLTSFDHRYTHSSSPPQGTCLKPNLLVLIPDPSGGKAACFISFKFGYLLGPEYLDLDAENYSSASRVP